MTLHDPIVQDIVRLMHNEFSGVPVDTMRFSTYLPDDWKELFRLAAQQGVLAITYGALKNAGLETLPPRELRLRWALSVENIETRYERQYKAAAALAALFNSHGIRMFIFKGLALSRYYPTPQHREFGDLDIYLFGDYEKGNAIIESMGIGVDYHDFKNSSFVFNGVLIENHHVFTYSRNESDRMLERHFSVSLNNAYHTAEGYFIPPVEFNTLYLLNHTSRHFIGGGFNMRAVIDWGVFLNACLENPDMKEIQEKLRDTGFVRFHDVITSVAAAITGYELDSFLIADVSDADMIAFCKRMFDPGKSPTTGNALTNAVIRVKDILKNRRIYDLVPYNPYTDILGYAIKDRLSGKRSKRRQKRCAGGV